MTAKPLPLELSESAEDKASDSKSNSENTLLSSGVTKESCDVKTKKLLIPPEEVDDSSSGLTTDGSASQRFKKSSFQITRIVKTDEAGDSTDDLDDVTSIEDIGSNIMEKSANANLESDVHSLDTLHSPSSVEDVESLSSCQKHLCLKPSHSSRPRPSDINSRFKIVKIESNKPLRRGRWMCLEFVDPPHLSVSLEKQTKHDDTESLVSSCIASPIYYVQVEKEDPSNNQFVAAAIIYSNGQPSLEPNPLPLRESAMSQSSCSNLADSLALPSSAMVQQQQHQQHDSGIEVMKLTSCLSSELSDREGELGSSARQPIPSSYFAHQPNSVLNDAGHRALMNGILFGSDGLAGMSKEEDRLVIRTGSEPSFGYSRVSEAVSPPLFSIVASTANSCPSGLTDNDNSGGICALDNKIEQAMDLVKSHLMFAVHEEVELLKEQIKELTIKKGQLEYENTVLRASATQETLEKLPSGSTLSTGLS